MNSMRRLLGTIFVVVAITTARGQDKTSEIKFSAFPPDKVSASSITWKLHFGSRREEPHNMYILMAQGGFRAPTSDDFEILMRSWLKEHSDAEAFVFYKLSPALTDFPDSVMKCVWVVSGNENLNLYLVRKGALPAGTQLLNPGDETSVSQPSYEAFTKEAIASEELAKKEKLGIWKSPD